MRDREVLGRSSTFCRWLVGKWFPWERLRPQIREYGHRLPSYGKLGYKSYNLVLEDEELIDRHASTSVIGVIGTQYVEMGVGAMRSNKYRFGGP